MTLVGRWRAARDRRSTQARAAAHAAGPAEGTTRQLDLLNAEWQRLIGASPYVARLHATGMAPARFESLQQFSDTVPPTTRVEVQTIADEIRCREPGADFMRTTGGSTSQPVQLPAWMSELDQTRPDMWLGRSWYGISPASRLFLLWGHSHLLGSGAAGWARARLREAADGLLGYERVSAYDLRADKLRRAGDRLLRHRPEYVIGYSVALDLFAQANADRAAEFRGLGVKVVIGTAERFPASDSVARLEALFGCPVGMEYGAVETGLVAHTKPAGGYDVFWNSYLLDAEPSDTGHRIYVTSLYPRCFPLLRYMIGDEVDLGDGQAGRVTGIRHFRAVSGRCNDGVLLDDGTLAHSELFTHAIRGCRSVRGFQIVQSAGGRSIRYLAGQPLDAAESAAIRERLGRIHPSLGNIALEHVESLQHTIAGKTRMVITE